MIDMVGGESPKRGEEKKKRIAPVKPVQLLGKSNKKGERTGEKKRGTPAALSISLQKEDIRSTIFLSYLGEGKKKKGIKEKERENSRRPLLKEGESSVLAPSTQSEKEKKREEKGKEKNKRRMFSNHRP